MMKVLFILSRFPYPLEKGDKLRAYQQIVNMHASGIEVHIAAISDCEVEPSFVQKLEPYCNSIRYIRMSKPRIVINLMLSIFRKLPLQVGYFYSKKNHSFMNRCIEAVQPDVIYCQLIRTALFVKDADSKHRVIDYQDAYVKGTSQRLKDAPVLMKWLFRRELRLVQLFEQQSYHWFNKHFVISEQDRNELAFPERSEVHILPNGIDTGFFHPVDSEKLYDVAFVGNMNYPPNTDAAVFLIHDIMPLVWEVFPDARVLLAGANPALSVRRLESKRVTVTGWVDDIRICYSQSRVFIAPMRMGTGLQNKLLEAMSMKIAAVTTPISADPLGAANGVDILVGDHAEALAGHIIRLLTDKKYADEMASNGHRFVTKQFSMEHSRILLKEVLNSL